MKTVLVASLAVLSALVGHPQVRDPTAQSAAERSFATLRSLAGEWQGVHEDGRTARITFRVMSGGSALLQELVEIEAREEMITMFHLNDGLLQLTHYCTAGNQPLMTASPSPDGKSVRFDFAGGSNLRQSHAGHMIRLVVRFVDAGRHTEEWTFQSHEGVATTDIIDLRRVGP
jgi:hypothetical protein